MNKTNNTRMEKCERFLNSKIEKLQKNEKRKLYQHLKEYYHQRKNVCYQTITKILFGDSLFLRPQHPPMIGPGIVSDHKSLQFIVPKKRVQQIRNENTLLQSHFMLRFLKNEPQHAEESESRNDQKTIFINFTINDEQFRHPIDKPFEIDLRLLNQEKNYLNFQFNDYDFQLVIVFQHMCKIGLRTVANAIVQRKTIPEEKTKKLLKKFLMYSFQSNKQSKKKRSNLMKIHKNFQIVSVKCPLSNTKIKIPTRSKKCFHLQCFDLCSFLLNAEKTKKWCCPICNKQAKLEDLYIDGYLKKIYKTKGLNLESKIQIFNDGKYKLFIPQIKPKRRFSQQNLVNFEHRQLNFQSLKINSLKKGKENNSRKRNILKIFGSQRDLLKNFANDIQQQKKKQKLSRLSSNQQKQIEETILALRTLSNWKSIQAQKITVKK
ncbi:zinc finger miz domain-containing protein [Anaeramoeba flamelloides]|uniref:Zinc finger miz domain-containing protein n=1 Tax=Anaeramoeba flamelloides TaxID=1746091 RepID=A0AAV7Z7M0_9EUKA|nr:zinc finger miz domain-containing protein [Anaeramoeba flamelloides]